MKPRSAIKTDLFADDHHRKKIDSLGDPLAEIESYIDFAALAAEVDRIAPRPVSPEGGRPPYPTETMVRILVLKRLYNLSDEQMEYQLLDRMSYKRFCGLANATNIPDRTTVWTFENRIGEAGAKALFDGVSAQRLKKGFIARGGQIIDATLVPAPTRRASDPCSAAVPPGCGSVWIWRGPPGRVSFCGRSAAAGRGSCAAFLVCRNGRSLEHVLNDVHGICQVGQHEAGKGQIVQSGQGFGQTYVIAGEAAKAGGPTEAALNHPAAR